jgi:two-component system chemotaxis response regulator CheB
MQSEQTPWIVAIGGSGAEGLDDIQELLALLPSTLAAIVMVVLHRSWNRPSELKKVLARKCALPVHIAIAGERLQSGNIYVGEPSEHLTLAAHTFGELIDDPDRHHGNRTVDLLFKSLAAHAGDRMIGVVLSGALDDGSRGLAAIHKAGGLTMVLARGTRPERGMPENAIDYDGPIDLIGSPRDIATGIGAVCGQ